MKENTVLEKSFAFAVRVVNMYKHLTMQEKEFILSKQFLRCGTSIGANVTEAQRAQSKPDFISKMSIALRKLMRWIIGSACYGQRIIFPKKHIRVCATITRNLLAC